MEDNIDNMKPKCALHSKQKSVKSRIMLEIAEEKLTAKLKFKVIKVSRKYDF